MYLGIANYFCKFLQNKTENIPFFLTYSVLPNISSVLQNLFLILSTTTMGPQSVPLPPGKIGLNMFIGHLSSIFSY